MSAQGAKEGSFVYADGKILAIQSATGGQSVNWGHYDDSGASYRSSDAGGSVGLGAEMDPMGADAGMIKPITWPQLNSPGKLEPYYGIPDLNSATQGCVLDRVPIPCDIFHSLMNNDAVQQEYLLPAQQTAPPKLRKRAQKEPRSENPLKTFPVPIVSRGLGIYSVATPRWIPDNEDGFGKWSVEFFAVPQNSDKAIAAAVDRARTILSTKNPCSDYFGTNAIKALNTFEKILTRGYPNGPGDTQLGIKQSGQQTTYNQPTEYRTLQNAVINNAGPFFNLLSKTRLEATTLGATSLRFSRSFMNSLTWFTAVALH